MPFLDNAIAEGRAPTEDEALLEELHSRRERAEKQAEMARAELRCAERVVAACSAAIDQLDDKAVPASSLYSACVDPRRDGGEA